PFEALDRCWLAARGLQLARMDILRTVAKALANTDDNPVPIDAFDHSVRPIAPLGRQLDAEHAERRASHERPGSWIRSIGHTRNLQGTSVGCADEPSCTGPDRGDGPPRVRASIADGAIVVVLAIERRHDDEWQRFEGLDPAAVEMIRRADTFFVATAARTEEATGGVDVSHRGGPRGFVHVEGNVLTIPDYRGNRYFNTLGNLVSQPRAALLFVDFATGDVLHLQGTTEIQWDGPEVQALQGAERLWRVHVARGWHRAGVLPLQWTMPAVRSARAG
ncbi:MAG TPA: pyridoxamine 5'-phosphate oxidase family protein, partial [Kofleriaceae bacterium]|nr:pyridoxamine 5'-phosphate oxidase family protein [Kofleriaceae bacterium]